MKSVFPLAIAAVISGTAIGNADEEIDSLFRGLVSDYATMRAIADNCDLAPTDWLDLHNGILDAVSQIPNADVLETSLAMDRHYEAEKAFRNGICSESAPDLHKTIIRTSKNILRIFREFIARKYP